MDLMKGPCLPHELVQWEVKKGMRRVFRANEQVFASSDICGRILEELKQCKPFTAWLEWEVYKIRLWEKHIIVVKKRFKFDNNNEFNLHREALRALWRSGISPTTLVSIPKLYGKFDSSKKDEGDTPDNSYIIMEYIPGKTIYNLMCASIVDYWLKKSKEDPRIREAFEFMRPSAPSHVELHPIPRWLNILSRHEIETGISFANDSEAEKYMEWVYAILLEKKVISYTKTWEKHRIFDDIKNVPVFQKVEFALLKSQLSDFLQKMHAQWFYHRDIAENPRNLMLWDDGRIYLIDFWRSKLVSPGSSEDVYSDWQTDGVYTNDNHLISYISRLASTPREDPAIAFARQVEARKWKVDVMILSRIAWIYGISQLEILKFLRNLPYWSSVWSIGQTFDRTVVSSLYFPALELGFMLARKTKKTDTTKDYSMRLLVQLAMLERHELVQLREVISEKNFKPDLKGVYLKFIDQYLNDAPVTSEGG